jgi:hypothetical protein
MLDVTPKFGRRTDPRHKRRALRLLFVWASLLSLFGLQGSRTAKAADSQSGPVTSAGPGPQFTIADFDGDLHPDIASIQAGYSEFSRTDYWIQVQLSAAGRQSIRVVGPIGGLQIEARDVNGDRAVDLVLVTAWFRKPVAILLNDGHGSFSRVEPTAFPEAFRESTRNWSSAFGHATDAVGVPSQSRVGFCSQTETLLGLQPHQRPILLASPGFFFDHFLVSHAGRAPPFELSHF